VLSTKFFETISRIIPGAIPSGKESAIASLDPDKIYLENVRSALGVSHRVAVRICETAVRQGFFRRGIEVLCPDGAVAASAEKEADLPVTVHCWTEEAGELEEADLPTESLRKITFYRLNEQTASGLYARSA